MAIFDPAIFDPNIFDIPIPQITTHGSYPPIKIRYRTKEVEKPYLIPVIVKVPVIDEEQIRAVEQKFDKKWQQLQKEATKKKRLRSDLELLRYIQDLETLENM